MKQLWGGRFQGGLDPTFEGFNRSLPYDCRLLQADLEGSVAWAQALGAAGVLAAEEVTSLTGGLKELGAELAADASPIAASDAEDVHTFVEHALTEKVGELARKLHTGRSRNDQVATDLKLWLRGAAGAARAAVEELTTALLELAERYADLPMPGYTHLQRAQPITVGHHVLAYVEMLARDRGRLEDALERAQTCPLGSGALAGSPFGIDREELAAALKFTSGPTRNSIDAVSDRDHVLELCFCLSTIMLHLSRLAEDWIFFASSEAGMLEFTDAVATGSSLLPQKKNPDAMELVRGKCGRVVGALQSLFLVLKGLPMAYNKDLQEDKELLFDAVDTTLACLRVTAIVARNVRFVEERCASQCRTGHLNATDLADLLVARGVPFRDAHDRAGSAVRAALELGVELEGLPAELRAELLPELGGDLAELLSTEAVLARRDSLGGSAPERVKAAIAAARERAGGHRG